MQPTSTLCSPAEMFQHRSCGGRKDRVTLVTVSLLLLIVAGAGRPAAPYVTSDLLNELGVLLLDLLGELLAGLDEAGQITL